MISSSALRCVCASVAVLAVCVLARPAALPEDYVRFDHNQVLRITPHTQQELDVLQHMRQNLTLTLGLDWWEEPSRVGRSADVRVPPAAKDAVQTMLGQAGVSHRVMIEDVQALVEQQLAQAQAAKGKAGFAFDEYHDLDDIEVYVRGLPAAFPGLVELLPLGKSYEGRAIVAVKIVGKASNGSTANAKPGFWIDGGIHAREWISPATVLYMLNELLTGYGKDTTITHLVDSLDIYILPVFNVDGYAYSWSTNRMWRKTRSPNRGSSCIGTDPNRNFDNHWGGVGTSKNPCDETYCGSKAFSEVEVALVAEFLERIPNLAAYFNIHSYSQLWLSPWGWTSTRPKDFLIQVDLAEQAVDALEAVHGTQYEYGPSSTTIYPTSGGSDDWTYGNLNVVFSYCIELRDTGKYGFLLPADQIVPTGEETFAGIKVSMGYVLDHQARARVPSSS